MSAPATWEEWLVAGGTAVSRARRSLIMQVIVAMIVAFAWERSRG